MCNPCCPGTQRRSAEPNEILSAGSELCFRCLRVLYCQHAARFYAYEEAVRDAAQLWITLPAFLFPQLGEQLLPIVEKGQTIICVPGGGGAEFAFQGLVRKVGCTLCGLQRVHSIARLKEYGRSVFMLGRKDSIQIGTIPCGKAGETADILSKMLAMPCKALPNYLSVTLTPSNPILHTSRLYSMFHDYRDGVFYDRNILFYEEWTDDASRVLLACDAELQELCTALQPLDLTGVRSLKTHYESETSEQMTRKISGIPAFKGLTSPMKKCEKGWHPDFTSRYFTADFAFGLKVIIDLAHSVGSCACEMESVWRWYLKTRDVPCDYFTLTTDREELTSYYLV